MQLLDNNEQEQVFFSSVSELNKINSKISKLIVRKEELTNDIISSLEHEHEGQKTYEYGTWRIEVKTPCVYSLDKKLYESGDVQLPKKFNPIKKSVTYSIDKRLCEQYMQDAPDEVRDSLAQLIEKRPSKAAVIVRERV